MINCHNRTAEPAAQPTQKYSVQIIHLEECSPPSRPRNLATSCYTSSYSSSAYTSSEDEESIGSSYCSSDNGAAVISDDDITDALRMKRIVSWREDFSSQFPSTTDVPSTPLYDHGPFIDRSSARRSMSSDGFSDMTTSTLCALSCPACDTFFEDLASLQAHGQQEKASEACTAAVQYAFETPAHSVQAL
ncbi:hypothetical protein CYLTODRAFT_494114 [Cylindrobasidium torrendii FP15055 ss-10]|uniref:Uncharacterized protein n=1 Tax=Cylindrobasidium torrendii FP15055 ss-10 TaxID=1314674 RepID=A0A0D7AZ05_9AGAR|nr:hypothetical protein CYLTODRAFT_494114 [Cylindrobasidium torrendii FP15055 ss-10]